MQPIVLTIAGSDSCGGAGIQADLKAIAANGGYGASVITAITAQNTRGVARAEAISVELLTAQLEAVFGDLEVAAVKTGMLASQEVIRTVGECLRSRHPEHYVCDPVLISKSGYPLLPKPCIEALKLELLPLAKLVTPNAAEAAELSGIEVDGPRQAERAGRRILDYGPVAVLVKGGHFEQQPATDVLVAAEGCTVFDGEPVETPHTHGTGCTYSAAIATQLARGLSLVEAIGEAKLFVTEAIRHGFGIGGGPGPTDPFFFLREDARGRDWISRLRADEGEER